MGIIKLFPEKDSTIYSEFPLKNTGVDEILEISAYRDISGQAQVARSILKFSTSDINNIITNKISGSFDVYLRLFLANASELPSEYTIYCHPTSGSWEMGFGREANNPQTELGISWISRSLSEKWVNTGSDFYSNIAASQSFVYNDSKDLNIKVTNLINNITSSIPNQGFILKHSSSIEYNGTSNNLLKYFSKDTHTIYPPCLEFKWDDSSYIIGSGTIVSNNSIIVELTDNARFFNESDIVTFRVSARDKYPVRTFQTSSVYLNNKLLPSSSYWGIRDLDTRDMIVDFDSNYTKISADSVGNYFKLYMDGLEPERFYEVLIKSIINGDNIIFNSGYYFKVSR